MYRRFSYFGEICIGKFRDNIFTLAKAITILAGVPIFLYASTAMATPAFVQANYAVPQSSQTSVTVPYTATFGHGRFSNRFVLFNQSVAIRRDVLDKIGGFDESL